MPVIIPEDLISKETLGRENIFTMEEKRAKSQDIRALKIGIVNLMPTKKETEVQLLRLISNTPLQIEIDFDSDGKLQVFKLSKTLGEVLCKL